MNDLRTLSPRAARRFAGLRWTAPALLATALVAGPGGARERVPFEARAGLDLARAAAQSWSPDAVLIYIENDEPLDAAGAAPRWGYLFHSAERDQGRAYSVREGRILEAENLQMKFEAPPVGGEWMDSGAALVVARREAGDEFCRRHSGQLSTMLLMRGAFQDEDLQSAAWTLIFTAPDTPSLFVMVDADDGRVRRTWRG